MALGVAVDLGEGGHPAGSAALLARGRIGAMLERDGGEVACPPRFLGGSARVMASRCCCRCSRAVWVAGADWPPQAGGLAVHAWLYGK